MLTKDKKKSRLDTCISKYSRTSMARTPMAHLPWLIRIFVYLRNSSDSFKKQYLGEFSYFITKMYVVCTH